MLKLDHTTATVTSDEIHLNQSTYPNMTSEASFPFNLGNINFLKCFHGKSYNQWHHSWRLVEVLIEMNISGTSTSKS